MLPECIWRRAVEPIEEDFVPEPGSLALLGIRLVQAADLLEAESAS